MNKFTFSYPTGVYFGEGSAMQAFGAELGEVGETVMLAYGGGSVKKNGVYDEMKALLTQAGKKVVDFSGIMSNPTYTKVQEGAALARERGVDFILAVGGGSVIDCCKVISAQAVLDEDIWNMEYGKGKFPTAGIPMGAVVTASGTGAEMNAGAVITYEEKKWKGPVFGTAASFAVLDPAYTMSVPPMQVLSGAFDTLSHAMETYFGTSDEDNVSDDVALAIMRNTVVNMRHLLKNINDKQARSNLMWDSAMAENGILKCGRLTDFQAHQIEHQLGAYTDCNHGQGLAVIHPVYYRHIVKDAPEKFTRFAKEVFRVDSAEAGVDALEDFIRECGLPTKMSQLKSTVEITPEVLRQVADTCNIIKCNPRELDREEIYQILMECM
ncbi:iron-containing alcohol dehydrogenase [Dorea acetigenes]|mgnify:FL=1|uniref:Iron-containing alcohol dehydrogenase n=1 Tax=Dorea acetigenes TaxID=2981787 RepID=A0ABT2RRM1_9FIRM|nr:iron-containing alcohol dehydrogenase [Dorea acetigenes]MCU6688006.1 iron-containing alcohol dehydrogenase [Dorea acetigenes]SCJ63060.1 NADH-dependent butanol dehydrogenase A [uncultured Clostridium sp.]